MNYQVSNYFNSARPVLEVLDLLDIYPWITKFQIILTVRVQFYGWDRDKPFPHHLQHTVMEADTGSENCSYFFSALSPSLSSPSSPYPSSPIPLLPLPPSLNFFLGHMEAQQMVRVPPIEVLQHLLPHELVLNERSHFVYNFFSNWR